MAFRSISDFLGYDAKDKTINGALIGGGSTVAAAGIYFGIKYLIRGDEMELNYLANQISNGDPKLVGAAQQINESMQQSSLQIAQHLQDRFADACTKVVGYTAIYMNKMLTMTPVYGEVHDQFCDTVRSALSNVSGDTSGLGTLILLGGIAGAAVAVWGLMRRS